MQLWDSTWELHLVVGTRTNTNKTRPFRNYLVILRIRHVLLAPHLGKYIIPVSTSLPIISHGGFPLKVQAIAGPDEVVHLGIASNACNNNSLVDIHC